MFKQIIIYSSCSTLELVDFIEAGPRHPEKAKSMFFNSVSLDRLQGIALPSLVYKQHKLNSMCYKETKEGHHVGRGGSEKLKGKSWSKYKKKYIVCIDKIIFKLIKMLY